MFKNKIKLIKKQLKKRPGKKSFGNLIRFLKIRCDQLSLQKFDLIFLFDFFEFYHHDNKFTLVLIKT